MHIMQSILIHCIICIKLQSCVTEPILLSQFEGTLPIFKYSRISEEKQQMSLECVNTKI